MWKRRREGQATMEPQRSVQYESDLRNQRVSKVDVAPNVEADTPMSSFGVAWFSHTGDVSPDGDAFFETTYVDERARRWLLNGS